MKPTFCLFRDSASMQHQSRRCQIINDHGRDNELKFAKDEHASHLPSWFFLPPPMYPVDKFNHRLVVMPLAAQRQDFGSDEMRGGSGTTGRFSDYCEMRQGVSKAVEKKDLERARR